MKQSLRLIALILAILASPIVVRAQYDLNWGLRSPQPKETLPKSKAEVVFPQPKTQEFVEAKVTKVDDNQFLLNNGWRMTDATTLLSSKESIFTENLSLDGWFNATVPGTVLTTLVDQGVYPDPYYGLNNLAIPDDLCRKDWWYRLEFDNPQPNKDGQVWLVFNGINYQAEI